MKPAKHIDSPEHEAPIEAAEYRRVSKAAVPVAKDEPRSGPGNAALGARGDHIDSGDATLIVHHAPPAAIPAARNGHQLCFHAESSSAPSIPSRSAQRTHAPDGLQGLLAVPRFGYDSDDDDQGGGMSDNLMPRSSTQPAASAGPAQEIWTTNCRAFADGSHPGIRFIDTTYSSEPHASQGRRDEGGVSRRHHTDPVVAGKKEGGGDKNKKKKRGQAEVECSCEQCGQQTAWVLSREVVYAYLAMRGAATQGANTHQIRALGNLTLDSRATELPDDFLTCPHAISKMREKLERAATTYMSASPRGVDGDAQVHGAIRGDGGPSRLDPDGPANFNSADISDGGDPQAGAISPQAFLHMAAGVGVRVDAEETPAPPEADDKPLPPLPTDKVVALAPKEGADEGWKDRVDDPNFRQQICEETRVPLTGSYPVSSNPSMLLEPPGVRHIGRMRGMFGTLFGKMSPIIGRLMDMDRLNLGSGPLDSLSEYSAVDYTETELINALNSPSASRINNIDPSRVLTALNQAEASVLELEKLEDRAHRQTSESSSRLSALRETLARVSAAAEYILHHRSSARRARIRRDAGRRLHELEYRRARALDGLRAEGERREGDMRDIREVEAALEREVERVGMGGATDVMEEASRLWDEDHERVKGEGEVSGAAA